MTNNFYGKHKRNFINIKNMVSFERKCDNYIIVWICMSHTNGCHWENLTDKHELFSKLLILNYL